MGKWKVFSLGLLTMAFFFSTAGVQFAAELTYPTKPIQLITPFAPGDTDNLLRPFIEKYADLLKRLYGYYGELIRGVKP